MSRVIVHIPTPEMAAVSVAAKMLDMKPADFIARAAHAYALGVLHMSEFERKGATSH